jgi:hypothetical protein
LHTDEDAGVETELVERHYEYSLALR